MPDYDFSGLCPRSFEHMVQALCCNVLGPGVVIFGDGPDGGREATFSGTVRDFPARGERWDGYVVVQAKFRQRPTGRPSGDAKWALAELRKELDAFASAASTRKHPDYYIFVTNVVLSPAQGRGKKDRADELLRSYQARLGLKDWRIWDFDQLCRFLDADKSVRSAYQVWITPGDIFAKLASMLEASCPDFHRVMVNYLQKELLDDHYSKLEQAGHSPENRVPLERVFVDLPVFGERQPEPPVEGDDENPLLTGFLAGALEAGACCLKAGSGAGMHLGAARRKDDTRPEPGRYVLVGGPGQGKSTLVQFLCQIHRARLLSGEKGIDADAREAVASITGHCASQGFSTTLARRFPIRIELARFAKTLASAASGHAPSLLAYVGERIRERTDFAVSAENLRVWLHEYPCLVVLDGLDEVPASSNRSDVLTAIRDFLIDIATCEADVLVVATTRPQGYNDEFAPERYRHQWLAPLSVPRALIYGEALLDLTYGQDAQRRNEVLDRLRDAAKVAATARLMESPLQVTILARLLAQVAKPPQERYRLFQQYYRVIFRREMERGVAHLSQLLRDYETDIDAIHYRIGLVLQIKSERARHTDATLSAEEFRTIVNLRLDEEGHEEDARKKLTDAIVTCATERLVFLVPTESGRVGFEIRSLQEFMASEAIMDGPDPVVIGRIREVAVAPYWQNVLLFAAGKCFAERQWLRDNVSAVCAEMNDDPHDPLGHAVLAGSRVALSLLEDGPARRQPAFSQALARMALQLLALPPSDVHDRLADVYEPSLAEVYLEEINHRMNLSTRRQLAAWRVLRRLVQRGCASWAPGYADERWPARGESQAAILRESRSETDPWWWRKYEGAFFRVPLLADTYSYVRARQHGRDGAYQSSDERVHAAMQLAGSWARDTGLKLVTIRLSRSLKLRASWTGLAAAREALMPVVGLKRVNRYWVPLVEGARFSARPCKGSLADALERLASCCEAPRNADYTRWLPWPLSACLGAADTTDSLHALAERARLGEFGDAPDWRAAELRWATRGLGTADLAQMTDDRWPIPPEIAARGLPLACRTGFLDGDEVTDGALADFWRALPGARAREVFATGVLRLVLGMWGSSRRRSRERGDAAQTLAAEAIAAMGSSMWLLLDGALRIFELWGDAEGGVSLLDALGNRALCERQNATSAHYYRLEPEEQGRSPELAEALAGCLERDPSRRGVLFVLAALASGGQTHRVPANLAYFRNSSDRVTVLSGLILELARRAESHEDALELADELRAGWSEDPVALMQFAECAVSQLGERTEAGPLFLRLSRDYGERNDQIRRSMLQAMMVLLSRRMSNLQDAAVWRDLSLPTGLDVILAR